ncbi:hypothetical protein GGI25_002712 [Coemansia spiralis]|uniref:Complex 1 LYR protein domain-containing protein n=2 Tax=Coemansia TaxID=4863 RepID=A0A9W8KY64_9FUNG|nr:hypothetical protein BX070DRAFT_252297 [Coemansia spiralis]KAJ1993540.1 hypothetical protein EDC05_002167 [Coemansia umbellata]KAJ2625217.1 hypothetical protein GGI26_000686 [Coemansia sp. RSA 1358]KAJ2677923.1 hypothetical protein GGI25_002712 [Coemansia spiralis]
MGTRRLSGLQKDVLRLYRDCLRAIKTKPEETQHRFRAFARQEFEKNIVSVKRTDVRAIEYMLRVGRRRMEQYMSPNVRDISFI